MLVCPNVERRRSCPAPVSNAGEGAIPEQVFVVRLLKNLPSDSNLRVKYCCHVVVNNVFSQGRVVTVVARFPNGMLQNRQMSESDLHEVDERQCHLGR